MVNDHNKSITVIMSTYNRAECLAETLEAFCLLNLDSIDVEFVVVDNNSSDSTPQVIETFKNKLPLVHLFEPKPGKNCALNLALKTVKLKSIVVFTDDDVTPYQDWLQAVMGSTLAYPDYAVFGGAVEVKWPEGDFPEWCTDTWFHPIAFASHQLGNVDRAYDEGSYPFGPNMWMRSTIFDAGFVKKIETRLTSQTIFIILTIGTSLRASDTISFL